MKITIIFLLTGLICLNNYNLSAQNAPINTIGAVVSYNDTALVPVTVTGFTNIGGCELLLNYDPTVATATSVTLGPGVGQFFFATDIETPGIISLSWLFFEPGIPGLTLPDSSVFFNITFERVNYGYSAIEFDNSLPDNCLYTDGNFDEVNDIPNSTYYIDGSITFETELIDAPLTSVPDIEECEGIASIDIPVTVSNFNQIGAFNLTMQYDSDSFSYQTFTNESGFPGLEVIENILGTIFIDGLSEATEGFTLENNSILCTIYFNNIGGSTALSWLDDGESCEYNGPAPDYEILNDNPQSSFYINGSFTELPFPAEAGIITGPGTVCQGTSGVTFSVSPIAYADSYEWTLPEGATIESSEGTHEIIVSFSENAVSGDVSVYGINECGNGLTSPAFPIIVEMAPSIIIQPVSPDTIYAGDGIASFAVTAIGTDLTYQWQEYTDDWADVTDGGVYSGSATSVLTITNPSLSMNGNYYRCFVSGNCEPPAISNGNAVLSVVVFTGFHTNNYGVSRGNDCLEFKSFPNPFSEQISFTFDPPSKGTVTIEIANIYGKKVAILTHKIATIEDNLITTQTKQLKPGIYIATITFKNEKVIIIKTLKIIAKSD